ncbi:hypothetical protein EV138_2362 [Kribbella voronezhensis]|uniref:Nucleotidyltransferase-like protein n=1 Tax=Kribbella voronezhensis TaxID=2512212 RepID=A0A4V3FK49_9ACTN|nr:hypothetical protein EV138_2362 [Kribbella voronezhensis]
MRAVAVFGSLSTDRWHELSDVDLDVVIADDVVVNPADEVAALFGGRTAIALYRADSADVVIDSLEEVSIRWHPLGTTSPNIASSVRVFHGELAADEVVAAGEANRAEPDRERLLDAFVRDAVGAWKMLRRGRSWDAVAAVQRMRDSLVVLRGRRDTLLLDPADPATALAEVIREAVNSFEFGVRRTDLLDRLRH